MLSIFTEAAASVASMVATPLTHHVNQQHLQVTHQTLVIPMHAVPPANNDEDQLSPPSQNMTAPVDGTVCESLPLHQAII